MLRDAHMALEVMGAACSAVKDERWADAQSALQQLQTLTTTLMREVGEKQRETLLAPKPDSKDRG